MAFRSTHLALCSLLALDACSGSDEGARNDARVAETSVDRHQTSDTSHGELGIDGGSDAGACAANADCSESEAPLCDTTTGRCVACRDDDDCSEPYAPRCAPDTKTCVECFDHAQCESATNGSRCVDGICSCESAADCTSSEVWGNRCVELEVLGYAFKMCGCNSAADCTGRRYGPQCHTGLHQCSCQDKSECSAPQSACARPASITDYAFCQAPCTTNTSCAGRMALTHCDTSSGACVECLGNEDCAQSPFGAVCATDEGLLTGSCVCNTVDDCPSGRSCALDAFGLMSCQ